MLHDYNPFRHRDLFLRSIITFCLQMGLIYLLFTESNGLDSSSMGTLNLNAARLICTLVLHILILEEVKSSLHLMRFVKYNFNKFTADQLARAFMVALMKMAGGLATEAINILVIVQSETIDDVVKDFIAFNIISEIDNLIIKTLAFNPTRILSEHKLKFKKTDLEKSEWQVLALLWE